MTKLLIEESCLIFQPSLAKRLGLNEAIILQQLHYWTISCKKNQEEGHVWIYNTYAQWQKQFPFWSEITVKRAIKSLEAQDIIISKSCITRQIKTKYYAINYNKISEFNLKTSNDISDQIDPMDRSKRTLGQINLIRPINIETKTTTKEYLSKKKEEILYEKNDDEIIPENSISHEICLKNNLEREMIDIWNSIFVEDGREGVSLTLTRKVSLRKAANYFKDDLAKWTSYCQKISSSKFLMGEVTNFKASIDWCIREETIIKIIEGTYKCGDRVGIKNQSKNNIIKLEPKSKDLLWRKILEEFKKTYGEATTSSWLCKLEFNLIDEYCISLVSDSKFIIDWVESRYLTKIKSIANALTDGKISKVVLEKSEHWSLNSFCNNDIKNYNREKVFCSVN
jgi:hypothetical protein